MLPSESCVWKWKPSSAPPEPYRALMTGSQLVPSGWMLQMPQAMLPWTPCDSSELKMMRPSLRTTGCRALPMLRWPIFSTFAPSSSIDEELVGDAAGSRAAP